MRTVPFTLEYCRELLTKGYSHFVIQNEQNKDGFFSPQAQLTFEPVRQDPGSSNGVAIKDIMHKGEDAKQYTIIVNDQQR